MSDERSTDHKPTFFDDLYVALGMPGPCFAAVNRSSQMLEEARRLRALVAEYRAGSLPLAEIRQAFGWPSNAEAGPEEIHDTIRAYRHTADSLRAQLSVTARGIPAAVDLAELLGQEEGETIEAAIARLKSALKGETARAELATEQWLNAGNVARERREEIGRAVGQIAGLNEQVTNLATERAHLRQELERAEQRIVDLKTDVLGREKEIRDIRELLELQHA